MKRIIALGGSNSKESINKQLAYYTAKLIDGADVIKLDLNDYSLPMYGIDQENELGFPQEAKNLVKLIQKADGIIISLAEHNGAYTAVFKNVFDWISRIEGKVFETTPVFLMATSPGARGGASVLAMAMERFPRHGAEIVASFSLPAFYDNFKSGEVVNEELKQQLLEKVSDFSKAI